MSAAPPRWRVPASPDSGDSQFFICFDDASFLNNQYTVWGKVTSCMENVDQIKRGEPVQNPDKIVTARMALDAALSRLSPLPVGRGRERMRAGEGACSQRSPYALTRSLRCAQSRLSPRER